jgi:hypothetical protein
MSFLTLVLTLPSHGSSERTRLWRALKALGCGTVRDGMYVLPSSDAHAAALGELAAAARAAEGTADVFTLTPRDAAQEASLRSLFDRSADYQAITEDTQRLLLTGAVDGTAARGLRALERRFEQLSAIDFFAGAQREQTAALLDMARIELARRATPDEPETTTRGIARLNLKAYQGRRWATRKRPWVDRLASAWLIKRRIDPRADFVWLDSPRQCRGDMLGFDFDGAAFTHVGERVTFEVLAASFGLDADARVAHLGRTVRYLDAGGVATAEARGLEAILAGLRDAQDDDDKLLASALKVFDWLEAGLTSRDDDGRSPA